MHGGHWGGREAPLRSGCAHPGVCVLAGVRPAVLVSVSIGAGLFAAWEFGRAVLVCMLDSVCAVWDVGCGLPGLPVGVWRLIVWPCPNLCKLWPTNNPTHSTTANPPTTPKAQHQPSQLNIKPKANPRITQEPQKKNQPRHPQKPSAIMHTHINNALPATLRPIICVCGFVRYHKGRFGGFLVTSARQNNREFETDFVIPQGFFGGGRGGGCWVKTLRTRCWVKTLRTHVCDFRSPQLQAWCNQDWIIEAESAQTTHHQAGGNRPWINLKPRYADNPDTH